MSFNRKLTPLLDRAFESDDYIDSIIERTVVSRNRQMSRHNGSDWMGA